MKDTRTYVVYKGDVHLATGSAEECAKTLGITPKSVRWMACTTPSRRANPEAKVAYAYTESELI